MTDVKEITKTVQRGLVNKYTVGASLLVVGASTLVGVPMSETLNRVLASPMGFDITILRFMGVLTTALGIAVVFHQDPLGVAKQV
jgi:hypothetical protein